jgi:hypothetical protein
MILSKGVAIRRPFALLTYALAFGACGAPSNESAVDAGAPPPDAGRRRAPPDAGPPPPEGAIEGQIVDQQQQPLEGISLLCCTPAECVVGQSNAQGMYRFGQLSVEPRKVLMLDPAEELMDSLFYQQVIVDQTTTLTRPAVMHERGSDPLPWTGGTIVLADGSLELTAAQDSLDYGRGITAEIAALRIDLEDLPPVSPEPWRDAMTGGFAYLITPVGIHASEAVQLRVLSGHGAAVGAAFALWAVDGKLATATRAGTATVTDDNVLTLAAEGELTDLGALILVPEG